MPPEAPPSLPLPVGGIDRSVPVHLTPEGRCPDALNVRAYDGGSGRRVIGKRAGLRRAFDQAAAAAVPGRALVACDRWITPPTDVSGTRIAVSDLASSYGTGGDPPMNWRANYVTFRKRRDAAWVVGAEVDTRVTAGEQIGVWTRGVAADGDTGFAVAYPTNNDMAVTFLPDSRALIEYESDACVNIGPFVRGSNDLKRKMVAYLEWTGSNRVRLVIDQFDETTVTRLATSPKEYVLRGSDGLGGATSCTIRLVATNTALKASVVWAGGAPGGINDKLEVDNTTWITQNRAGVIRKGNAVAGIVTRISRMQYTRIEPYGKYPLRWDMRAPLISPAANQFQIPDGMSASGATIATFTPALTAGPVSAAAADTLPRIDTTDDTFESTAASSNARNTRAQIFAPSTTPAGTLAIELAYRDIDTGSDTINPCFRLNPGTHQFMIRVELNRAIAAVNRTIGESWYNSIVVAAIWNNGGVRTRTVLFTETFAASGTGAAPIFPTSALLRWTHTPSGVNNGGVIRCFLNGIELWSHDYSADAAWTAGSPNPSQTVYGDSVGVDIGDQGVQALPAGFKVLDISPPAVTTVNPGTDVVALSPAAVEVYDMSAPAGKVTATGETLTTAAIQCAQFRDRLLCVDGSASRIVNLTDRKVEAWINVSGTDLDGAIDVAVYRDCAVLLKKDDWYISRVGDPLDWDFGGEVAATRAVAGTNPEYGRPSDLMVAAVPIANDYLIFGCQKSVWIMRGDPRAGGRVEKLFSEGGFLDTRAWCYDALGNVYFLGTSGLYYIDRNNLGPQLLVGRRLYEYTENVDPTVTLVQMAFDALARCVHLFLTPRDGTVGRHVVFDVGADRLDLDQYPALMQPWAVAAPRGKSDRDRRLFIVGPDGYVRRFDSAATSDDGEPIDAYVRFTPIGRQGRETLADQLQVTLGPGSGAVDYAWLTADSAAQVNAKAISAADQTGTLAQDGWQTPVSLHRAGGSHQLVLRQVSSAATFTIEDVGVGLEGVGVLRR